MRQLLTVEEYRLAAKRKLPRVAFEYIDGGSEGEWTLRANQEIFDQVAIRPRQAVQIAPTISQTIFGFPISMPILLAPCGMARVIDPAGDLAGVRAAGTVDTAFTLTTMSGHSIEEVAAARSTSSPLFYQIYRVGGRERVAAAVTRAKNAGFDALVVTVDTNRNGYRPRNVHNGVPVLLTGKKRQAIRYVPGLARHPRYFARRIMDGLVPTLQNVIMDDGRPQRLGTEPRALSLVWDDIAWLREQWSGPIIIKGVLTAADALQSLEVGADGIIVSNHGGRQLDYLEPTLRVLPEIVTAVDGRCDVLMDSGIRRGTDIVKALALGAKAVLVGRPWCFGLAVGGQEGIERVMEMLRRELSRTMGFIGCPSLEELNESYVRAPSEWFAQT